jgi:hypothetical protein
MLSLSFRSLQNREKTGYGKKEEGGKKTKRGENQAWAEIKKETFIFKTYIIYLSTYLF